MLKFEDLLLNQRYYCKFCKCYHIFGLIYKEHFECGVHNECDEQDIFEGLSKLSGEPHLFSRTYDIVKESVISPFIIIRLEILEHHSEKYDDFLYSKTPKEIDEYEWVIHIYIKGVDELSTDIHMVGYNIHKYDEFIIRLGYVKSLDKINTNLNLIEEFNEVCKIIQNWVKNGYKTEYLDPNVAFPILKKLIKAGNPLAARVYKDEATKNSDNYIIALSLGLLDFLDNHQFLQILEEKIKQNKIVRFRNSDMELLEAISIIELEKIIGKKLKIVNNRDELKSAAFPEGRRGYFFLVENNHIVGLNLCNNSKNFYLPDSIGNLKYLEILLLSNTHLEWLPMSIINLQRLELIDLIYSKFFDKFQKREDKEEYRKKHGYLASSACVDAKMVLEYYKLQSEGKIQTVRVHGKIYEATNNILDLKKLNIKRIIDIENIENLKYLKVLNLNFNEITKINNLNNLINLEELHLKSNKIKKIENLDSLINLKELDLSFNHIKEIENLEKLTNLQHLGLSDNKIMEIKGLDNLKNLQILGLLDNPIDEMKGLESLKKLQRLDISFFHEISNNFIKYEWQVTKAYVEFCQLKKNTDGKFTIQDYLKIKKEQDQPWKRLFTFKPVEIRSIRNKDFFRLYGTIINTKIDIERKTRVKPKLEVSLALEDKEGRIIARFFHNTAERLLGRKAELILSLNATLEFEKLSEELLGKKILIEGKTWDLRYLSENDKIRDINFLNPQNDKILINKKFYVDVIDFEFQDIEKSIPRGKLDDSRMPNKSKVDDQIIKRPPRSSYALSWGFILRLIKSEKNTIFSRNAIEFLLSHLEKTVLHLSDQARFFALHVNHKEVLKEDIENA
ncbi:MAG: leucine-rich repeat domain-containing protein, partial [Candidatus Hodarchaeota archaeon]